MRSSLELSTIKLLELWHSSSEGLQWWLLTNFWRIQSNSEKKFLQHSGPRCTSINGLQGFVAVLLKNLMVDELLFLQNLQPSLPVHYLPMDSTFANRDQRFCFQGGTSGWIRDYDYTVYWLIKYIIQYAVYTCSLVSHGLSLSRHYISHCMGSGSALPPPATLPVALPEFRGLGRALAIANDQWNWEKSLKFRNICWR